MSGRRKLPAALASLGLLVAALAAVAHGASEDSSGSHGQLVVGDAHKASNNVWNGYGYLLGAAYGVVVLYNSYLFMDSQCQVRASFQFIILGQSVFRCVCFFGFHNIQESASNEEIDSRVRSLFLDLPGIVFANALTVIVVDWARQHYRFHRQMHVFLTRVLPAIVAFNLAAYVSDTAIIYTMTNTQGPHKGLTAQGEMLSDTVFFLLYLGMAALLLLYGWRHWRQLDFLGFADAQRRRTALTAAVCAASCLIRVGFLVNGIVSRTFNFLSANPETSQLTLFLYYIICEVLPSLIVCRLQWDDKSRFGRSDSTRGLLSGASGEFVGTPGELRGLLAEDWQIAFSSLRVGKKIAAGSAGQIFRGEYCGSLVAVKELFSSKIDEMDLAEFKAEASIMAKLHHPNVVRFLGACVVNPHLYLVTELMAGSLEQVIDDDKQPLELPLIARISRQLAAGLAFLHAQAVVHRDVKPSNVLHNSSLQLFKIADFGMARLMEEHSKHLTSTAVVGGTPTYMAPEQISHKHYTQSVDVWAYGIVLWQLLNRRDPYDGQRPFDILLHVSSGKLRPERPAAGAWPDGMEELVFDCLNSEPSRRPTFPELQARWDGIYPDEMSLAAILAPSPPEVAASPLTSAGGGGGAAGELAGSAGSVGLATALATGTLAGVEDDADDDSDE
eukprot:PLAT3688.1.p1 GENE.PLAT3688.1~~PLAT3688.1.p1  ORF type:complete len:671 (+),score=253.23 PLAT3688.1:3-2015(+)